MVKNGLLSKNLVTPFPDLSLARPLNILGAGREHCMTVLSNNCQIVSDYLT